MDRPSPPGVEPDSSVQQPSRSYVVSPQSGSDYWTSYPSHWSQGMAQAYPDYRSQGMAQAYPDYRTYYPYHSHDLHARQQPPPPTGAPLVMNRDPRNSEAWLRNTPAGQELKHKIPHQDRTIQKANVEDWRNAHQASFTPAAPVTTPPPPPLPPAPVDQLETKKPETAPPMKPVILVGKRRGGRVLPTGNLGVTKKPKTESEKGRSDAWSRYMAEVSKYKERSCEEDRKNRPLVK